MQVLALDSSEQMNKPVMYTYICSYFIHIMHMPHIPKPSHSYLACNYRRERLLSECKPLSEQSFARRQCKLFYVLFIL